ncbi:hypothetical protein [Vibrio cholerae]|uniref:hypothetical protein n=1 Tax=Vibrio cholerae TaxID=666 RepID=UPI003C70477F
MNNLPLLLDAREAIDYYHQHPGMTDAEKAYVVAFLSGEGRSNSQIREDLGIEKVYTVTHLKRAEYAIGGRANTLAQKSTQDHPGACEGRG